MTASRLDTSRPAHPSTRTATIDGGPPGEAAASGGPSAGAGAAGCLLASVVGMMPVVAFAGAFGRTPPEALLDPRYLLPTAGAALATAVACLVTALATRLPPVTRLTVGMVALAGYLVLVVPSDVFSGPHRMLSAIPPLDLDGAELAVVALLAGLSALAAAETVLRGRPVVWALPVALLGTAAGLAVSAPAGAAGWLGPVAALVVAVFLVLGAWPRGGGVRLVDPGERRSRRSVMAAVPVVVAAGVAASVFLPGAIGAPTRPRDARDLLPQPVSPRQVTSPLAQFPALHTGRSRVRLSVTADRPVTRLRYATLTAYDGTYWTSRATYRRAGTRLPGPDQAGVTVTERVRVEDAGEVGMLASSGRPVEVSIAGFGVDRDTGDVVFPTDRPMPSEYTVRSVVPSADEAGLAADTPARGPAGDAAVAVFAAKAREIVGADGGYKALRRLTDHFAKGDYAESSALRPPSGHGSLQIRRLMADRKGTAEQYASAFAVLARSLGYDARVVVGFHPAKRQAGGRYQITERDVDAWAEVRFDRAGWVAFHPTPRKEDADQTRTTPEEEPVPPPADDRQRSEQAAPPSARQEPPRSGRSSWPWLLVAAAVALVAAPVAVPVHKWAARTRRRRAADPRRRVATAWRETLDRYADAGLNLTSATTAGEAAAAAATRFPAASQPTRDLLQLVNAAMYDNHEVGHADGERAWALADTVCKSLGSALPLAGRVTAALRPRWGLLPISRRPARS